MLVTPLKDSLKRLARWQAGLKCKSNPDGFRLDMTKPQRLCHDGAISDASYAAHRQARLAETLRYAAVNSPYYREAFAGVDLEAATVNDLSALPFLTAGDISAHSAQLMCQSQTQAERAITFASSGTLGPQKRLFFSHADMQAVSDFMACGIATVLAPGEAVQILLPGGLAGGQAGMLEAGVRKMGGVPVVAGMDLPYEQQIALVRQHRPKVIFGETHLLYRITKAAEARGLANLRDLGVRTLFLTASYASPVMRANLERAWGCDTSIHYGMTEMGLGVAVGCPACGGMHYNELGVIFEIVDPETGKPVPDGTPGEVVATSLGREAMPIIRFRTGDVTTMRPATSGCPCAPMRVIDPVPYRQAARVQLANGQFIHPTFFHDAVFSVPEVVDYELTLQHDKASEALSCAGETLVVEVEATREDAEVAEAIADNVRAALELAQDRRLQNGNPAALAGEGFEARETCERAKAASLPRVCVEFKPHDALRQGRHFKKLIRDLR